MKTIAILRHGEAEYGGDADASRILTDNGISNSHAAATTLNNRITEGLDAIFYSPFVRTHQTAKIVHASLTAQNNRDITLAANHHLLGDSSPYPVCQWLDTLPYERMLLVSHQPLVSCLADWMVQGVNSFKLGGADNYPFFPSSLAILSADIIAQGCAELNSLSHHPMH